jgi:dephospho-CoA kinase
MAPQGEGRAPRLAEDRKPVVALIGGIGSGKSRVAAELARRGARVLAGDQLGHEALRQPEIRDQVARRWGPGVLDEHGEIDRRRLGLIVFADPAELRALEALEYPWIERRFREEIRRANADPAVRLIVLDAAVLLEAGWNAMCDWIVFIHAPRPERLRRVRADRGWSEKEVEARERAQMSLTEKVSRADFAVDNSQAPEHVADQLDALLHRLGAAK